VSNFLARRDAMDPKRSPSPNRPLEGPPKRGSEEEEIERREDREGIPGYGQPPEEVRTLHPRAPEEGGEEDEKANRQTEPPPFD
jgi:hypothetical protein